MLLPDTLPAARGNSHADDPNAAKLGFSLFFDLNAISSDNIRCAACHLPEHGFATSDAMAIGIDVVHRNSPAIVDAAWTFPIFWDGRADSLWSQSLFTMENDAEMGGTRLAIVHQVQDRYRAEYEAAFGPMPALDDGSRFPASGKPGSDAWASMTADDQKTVTRIYVNVGKSFEAYMRLMARRRAPFDRFLLGDASAISESAKAGVKDFLDFGCATCHSGPTLTDGGFHRLDLPLPTSAPNRDLAAADTGRAAGLAFIQTSEFNALSSYYEAAPGEIVALPDATTAAAMTGAFRTPSLRNVSDSAPYGHSGVFTTLEDIVRFKLAGGGPASTELTPHVATDQQVADLVAFLQTLRGDDAPLPWSNWPSAQASDAGGD